MDQYYFKAEKLTEVISRGLSEGEKLLGFVFTPGLDSNGNRVVFMFPRIENSNGIYVKEVTTPEYSGCPYPPPCDPEILKECY